MNGLQTNEKQKGAFKEWIWYLLSPEFIRFVFVACLNTAFGYGLFAFFIWIGLHYTLATLLGTIIGVLFNFKTYGLIVFKNKNNKLIFRFIVVYVLLYICNIGGIALLKYFGCSSYLAGLIVAAPVGLLGYLLNKKFVYDVKCRKKIGN
ncbi:MAG: GtrA family protein [Bacteroidales bacterium]|nr:GtrA family protein [Bacteroidales bacterium]